MTKKKKTDDLENKAPDNSETVNSSTEMPPAQPENPQKFDDSLNNKQEDLDYEELRQKLLKEYNDQKNDNSTDTSAEDNSQIPEHDDETHLQTDDHQQIDQTTDHQEDDNYSSASTDDETTQLDDNFSDNQLNIDQDKIHDNIAPDVDQGISKVAINKQSSIAVMIVVALVMVFIIYKFLQSSKPTNPAPEISTSAPLITATPQTGQTIVIPEIPKLPTAPTLAVPIPNDSAPPPPPVANLSIPAPALPTAAVPAAPAAFTPKANQADAAARKARLNSSMMSGGGAGPHSENVSKTGQSLTILKRNTDQISATYIGDLRRVVAEGKIIDAILETAINTDLPGIVRAIVTRDIYSEAGKNVLVARGSRLIGSYSSNVTFGINRVNITWTRLIRPDGVDVNIRAPGIDQLGRSGNAGEVNNHLMLSLTSAVMSSIIDIAVAAYADSQSPQPTGATTSVSGGSSSVQPVTNPTTGQTTQQATTTAPSATTVTATPTQEQQAYLTASQNISQVGTNYLSKIGTMGPTITIDQGTVIKVFVNKDIIFPGVSANLTKVVE